VGFHRVVETDSVKTHVANLRAKLGDPCWIATIRGFGYRFEGVT
jgi:DNA-binding response OmpR family regulator